MGSRLLARQAQISIHALREEGDWVAWTSDIDDYKFLSTPSARRATGSVPGRGAHYGKFLSTPSARRATKFKYPKQPDLEISIHALREEGDRGSQTAKECQLYFYPRPPRGGRLAVLRAELERDVISIHALREEGDPATSASPCSSKNFYPRPPRGGRQQKQRQNLYFQTNYTTFCTNLEEP